MNTCEYCGLSHEGAYGAGRFCNERCARGFSTKQKRQEISLKAKNLLKGKRVGNAANGRSYPFYKKCKNCYERFQVNNWKESGVLYCSSICRKVGASVSISNATKGKSGGLRPGSGIGKRGWYEGVRCDSTYELAFVIKCKNEGITIERNLKYFTYGTKNRRYYPDFLINGDYFVEVKGFVGADVEEKLDSVRACGYKIFLVTKEEIIPLIKQIESKFGVKRIEELYSSIEDCMNTKTCKFCGAKFFVNKNKKSEEDRKYCSRLCGGLGRKASRN